MSKGLYEIRMFITYEVFHDAQSSFTVIFIIFKNLLILTFIHKLWH